MMTHMNSSGANGPSRVDEHGEVLRALEELAPSGDVGERIRRDRQSELRHLGVRTPARRKLVSHGFSFTRDTSAAEVLASWDRVWAQAGVADVLFAALDHYRAAAPYSAETDPWATTRRWADRIDNWAHADDLARVYSFSLEREPAAVLPQLRAWNEASDLWLRRISLVSLIHYSGKNAFFLPFPVAKQFLDGVVDDDRPQVQKAVGWVLREASRDRPAEVIAFVNDNSDALARSTVKRATERLTAAERSQLS